MGAFGSVDWPEPLIPTDQQINGPKGQLWSLNDPISLDTINRNARAAVNADTVQTQDALLQSVRIVSLKFISLCALQVVMERMFANLGLPCRALPLWNT